MTDDKILVAFHAPCTQHERCVVYYQPDRARNRLRGRAVHVRSWTLYNGRADDEVMVRLPNVTVPSYRLGETYRTRAPQQPPPPYPRPNSRAPIPQQPIMKQQHPLIQQ